jgi:hypothetical protein
VEPALPVSGAAVLRDVVMIITLITWLVVRHMVRTGVNQACGAAYLGWHLLLRDVQLEQIRGDRVLHEALAVRADPLHLAAVFYLSTATEMECCGPSRQGVAVSARSRHSLPDDDVPPHRHRAVVGREQLR